MASNVLDVAVSSCDSVQEVLSKFKVEELKTYLRDRALNLSGGKRCLAEKVFGAYKLGIRKATTEEQDAQSKSRVKEKRLCLEDGVIKLPPPSNLQFGWQLGSTNFPNTIEDDVEKYLKDKAPKALLKGSSLEYSKHVSAVAYHTISPNLKYCYVKGKIIPQERTNNDPYNAWVCLKKDNGSVVTAECSCVAGIAGVCKHIGALLYHVASEVRKGNNKTCTSKKQQWGIPSVKGRKKYSATPLNSIPVKKAKPCSSMPVLQRNTLTRGRSDFDPRSLADRQPMSLSKSDLQSLDVACKGNCTLLLCHKPWDEFELNPCDSNNVWTQEETTPVEVFDEPRPITALAKDIEREFPLFTMEDKKAEFFAQLNLTTVQQERILSLTIGQSATVKWLQFRAGLITATKLLAVIRKYDDNLMVKNIESAQNLVINILQYKAPVSTKAMQWGVSNESIARKIYTRVMKTTHKNFLLRETGLTISTDDPFLGASPDALVSCKCCGKGVAEFKVPWSVRDKPVAEHQTVFEFKEGEVRLRRNHEYFFQCQMQMAITNCVYCDFFMLTSVDHHLERINFDEELWQSVLPKLKAFFYDFILPEMFECKLLARFIVQNLVNEIIDRVISFYP